MSLDIIPLFPTNRYKKKRRIIPYISGKRLEEAIPFTQISLWDDTVIPANPDANDPDGITLGVKFKSDVDGRVAGVRFYKGDSDNGGTHTGLLYDTAGNLLNSVIFTGESASGWQQQLFASPTNILADTVYIIAYHAPQGHYSANGNYFTLNDWDNVPLHALDTVEVTGNGVFTYDPNPTFPTSTFNATNYWIDLVFEFQE